MPNIPTLTLSDGTRIPQLGFGTWNVKPEDTARIVGHALAAGYRHIDTAEMYRNERQVGEAIRAAGLARGDVFVTSKLNNDAHRPDDARRAFDATLEALGSDYVDLFLIHWPLPTLYDGDFVQTWNALVEFANDGRARSVGVSNFTEAHLARLAAEADRVPSVNQIEVHPTFTNDALRAACHARGITVEAWSPLGQGDAVDHEPVTRIAERLGQTPAQVVLRWHLQRGDVVFPRSNTPAHIDENIGLFDFELSPGDVDAITALDRGAAGRKGPDPDTFDWIPSGPETRRRAD